MNSAEYNYLIYNKELLAIMRAFKEYRAELEGLANPTQVYSNYKALKYFITTKNLSTRQARWAELLSQYHFKIIYYAGKANQKADALTRRKEDIKAQNALKKEAREQIAIPSHKVDSQIKAKIKLAPMSPNLTPITLTDHLL
jgi:cellobiose-specific phosphotransferase system component IIA